LLCTEIGVYASLAPLKECRRHHIHTCLEKALNVHPAILESVYPATDMLIADIKHADSELHKKYTGAGNESILGNLIKTVVMLAPLVVCIPVVPAYNNDEKYAGPPIRFINENLYYVINDIKNRNY
jgi:pyruvate formate lyase activating enzyme